MFAVSREEMLAGLEHMEENKLTYSDAHCPKCRRANRVERARMERFFPDWKKAIKTMAKAADQAEDTNMKPAEASQPEKADPKVIKNNRVAKKK
jgi:pterin-4a-carbinolamine dehydratase